MHRENKSQGTTLSSVRSLHENILLEMFTIRFEFGFQRFKKAHDCEWSHHVEVYASRTFLSPFTKGTRALAFVHSNCEFLAARKGASSKKHKEWRRFDPGLFSATDVEERHCAM